MHNDKSLFELNCVEKTSRSLSTTVFSKGGGVLASSEMGDFTIANEWSFIIPGTFTDLIYQEVCKESKK
jgi:hypothetical protein